MEVEPEPADGDEPEVVTDETASAERRLRETKNYYTPLVRSIAAKENITESELASIKGSGREGRVTKADILAYLKTGGIAPLAVAPTPGLRKRWSKCLGFVRSLRNT